MAITVVIIVILLKACQGGSWSPWLGLSAVMRAALTLGCSGALSRPQPHGSAPGAGSLGPKTEDRRGRGRALGRGVCHAAPSSLDISIWSVNCSVLAILRPQASGPWELRLLKLHLPLCRLHLGPLLRGETPDLLRWRHSEFTDLMENSG